MGLETYESNGGKITMQDGYVQHLGDYYLHADGGHLEIGHDIFIGKWTMIICNESIRIGDGTIIAERTSLRDSNHGYTDMNTWIKHQDNICKPIEIGSGCWVGANCLILAGSKMGNGSVLAGNSVLTGKHIPDFEIWGGNPARKIKSRFNK